jgi:hypothetical protein
LGFSAGADLILRIEDYATAPLNRAPLARKAGIARCRTGSIFSGRRRAAPDGSSLTISTVRSNIFDKKTKEFTTYLDFNGRGKPGLFPKFTYEQGFAKGW